MQLNLGCGPVQPSGWINIDGSNRAWLATHFSRLDRILVRLRLLPPTEFNAAIKFLNLNKRLPFDKDTIHYIYAGELWEHLEHRGALALAEQCYRVLIPGGVLRICVPDGLTFWSRYLELCEREMAKLSDQQDATAIERHIQLFFNDICVHRPSSARWATFISGNMMRYSWYL